MEELRGLQVRVEGVVADVTSRDSLKSAASIKLYATSLAGDYDVAAPSLINNTAPWTKLTLEMDVPHDTYQLWGWLLYNAPAEGKVYFDDASLEVLGPAAGQEKAPPAKEPPTPRPPGRRLGR